MFWIGLFVGLILGAIFGIVITWYFLDWAKDDEYKSENIEDDDIFEGFEIEIEEEWFKRGVSKNGNWKR